MVYNKQWNEIKTCKKRTCGIMEPLFFARWTVGGGVAEWLLCHHLITVLFPTLWLPAFQSFPSRPGGRMKVKLFCNTTLPWTQSVRSLILFLYIFFSCVCYYVCVGNNAHKNRNKLERVDHRQSFFFFYLYADYTSSIFIYAGLNSVLNIKIGMQSVCTWASFTLSHRVWTRKEKIVFFPCFHVRKGKTELEEFLLLCKKQGKETKKCLQFFYIAHKMLTERYFFLCRLLRIFTFFLGYSAEMWIRAGNRHTSAVK